MNVVIAGIAFAGVLHKSGAKVITCAPFFLSPRYHFCIKPSSYLLSVVNGLFDSEAHPDSRDWLLLGKHGGLVLHINRNRRRISRGKGMSNCNAKIESAESSGRISIRNPIY